MVSVDLIGRVRRAYFEQRLPIKEIVRTLSVSRATVRKIIRSHKTEFKYELARSTRRYCNSGDGGPVPAMSAEHIHQPASHDVRS